MSNTPKVDRSLNTSFQSPTPDTLQFSPINVQSGRSPLKGRLTGDARKVKDNIADLYNYIQKWKKCVLDGSKCLAEITEILSEENNATKSEEIIRMLLPKTSTLENIIEKMEHYVNKFQALNKSLKGIEQLELFRNDDSIVEQPLFQTWTISEFGEQSERLLRMYEKELELKKMIFKNICHNYAEKELLIFYSSAWIHEPYIELQHDFLLESMLVESGHK
ncbi:DgyrCDS7561 [Dimorphilus gyrociliatus]|uniref:DgyrCDS7561 n=1 Tax=Dimorphilus gyrociliatus TaxID=2664684 RepID=A0A7I8VSC7_9ANNE|nr:DgyrCDS7561 [Dimorphilus gyrociliatus]